MSSTLPPRPDGAEPPNADWGLRRAVRLEFPEPAAVGRDAAREARLGTYLTDLLEPFGLALTPGALDRGGQSYGEMSEALIRRIVPADDPVDLLVLAYAIPDVTPGRATTTYLSHICPGGPLAFAVSDQGPAAAFTALRLIREYARNSELRRALLLVVEQAALPYDPGVPVPVPAGHTGVALLFGAAARTMRVTAASVRVGCPDGTLTDEIRTEVSAGSTAIVGFGVGLGAHPSGRGAVRSAPAGQPSTGVWWELAGLLSEADAPPERVVLVDREPASRSLCLAAFDAGGRR